MGGHYFNEIQKIWKKVLSEDSTKEDINNSRDALEKINDEIGVSNASLDEKSGFWESYSWLFSFIECSKSFLSSDKIDEIHVEMIDTLLQDPSRLDQLLNEENRTHLINKLKAFKEQLAPKKTAEDYQHEYQDLWAKVVDPNVTEQELDSIIEKAEQLQADVLSSGNLNVEDIKQIKANKANISSIAKTVRLIKTGNLNDKDIEFMQFMFDAAVRGEYNKFIGNNAQAQINLASLIFSTFKRTMDEYKQEKENNANKEPVAEKSVSDMFVTDINKPQEASVEKAAVEVNITNPEPVSKMFETGINKPQETSVQEKQAAEVNIQKPEPEKTPNLESEKSIFIELSLRLDGIWEMFLRDSLAEEDYAAIVANAKQASAECDKYKDRIHQTYYDGFTNTAKAQKILADILHKLGEGQFSNGELDTLHHNLDAIKNFLMKIPVGVSEGNRNALIDKRVEIQQKIENNEIKAGSNPIEMEQTYENIRKVWRNLLESYNDSQYYSDMQRSINVARTECYENPGITDEDKRAFEQIFQLQSYYADANAKFFDRGMDYYSLQHLLNQFREISDYIEHSETGMTRNQLDEIYYVINNRINQIRARMEEESSFGGRGGGRY